MYLRKKGNWELWGSFHPAGLGCDKEGSEPCDHAYHLVNLTDGTCLSFDSYEEAEGAFESTAGAPKVELGKLRDTL